MKKILFITAFLFSFFSYSQIWLGNTDRQKVTTFEMNGPVLEFQIQNDELQTVDLSQFLDAPTASEIVTALNTQLANTRWSVVEVPSGGTTGQVLKKDTNTDYDYSWQDDGGSGGTYTAGNGLNLNTDEFSIDSTRVTLLDMDSPLTGPFQIAIGTTAALDALSDPVGFDRLEWATDGSSSGGGGGIQSVVAGTNITITGVGSEGDPIVVSAPNTATASVNFGNDNRLLKSSGTGKDIQATGIVISDTNVIANVLEIVATDGTFTDVSANSIVKNGATSDDILLGDGSTVSLGSLGSGATNLSYTTSATQGTVVSDTGTDAVIPAGSTTNASLMLPGDKTKLNGIESGADVTDTANVTAAGALMDSEVDADIKTLSIPASTTISAFGASLIDDAADTNARTTLGLADEDIQDKVGAMWSANTESGASVTYQDTDGTMDITVSANTTNIVDGAVNSAKITDNSILEADLNASNAPTDNHILTYNSAASNFTWVDPATLGSVAATSGNGTSGITLVGATSGSYTIGSQSWSWNKVGPFVYFTISLLDCDGTTPTGTLRINVSGTTIPNWSSGNTYSGIEIENSPVSWSYAYASWLNQDYLHIYYRSASNTSPSSVIENADMTDAAFYISGMYITND